MQDLEFAVDNFNRDRVGGQIELFDAAISYLLAGIKFEVKTVDVDEHYDIIEWTVKNNDDRISVEMTDSGKVLTVDIKLPHLNTRCGTSIHMSVLREKSPHTYAKHIRVIEMAMNRLNLQQFGRTPIKRDQF